MPMLVDGHLSLLDAAMLPANGGTGASNEPHWAPHDLLEHFMTLSSTAACVGTLTVGAQAGAAGAYSDR